MGRPEKNSGGDRKVMYLLRNLIIAL